MIGTYTPSGEPFMVMIYHTLDSVEKTLSIQSHCHRIIGVSDHLLSIVFWFHCHPQKLIGSLEKKPTKIIPVIEIPFEYVGA